MNTFKKFGQHPKIILAALAIFMIGAFAGSWTAALDGHLPFTAKPVLEEVSHAANLGTAPDVSFSQGFAPVAKRVIPAVVNIASSKVVRRPDAGSGAPQFSDPFFRQFFGNDAPNMFNMPKEQRQHALGSGVIVSADGNILTNNHVIDGATDIKVTLSDNREFKAKVVGTDPRADIAVLKIDAGNLPVVPMGKSAEMEVGNFVLAVGNPFGVGRTVTMGIISATRRGNLGIEDYEDFIQTDAPINPGNSGGALVNMRGELIGINTAILTGGGGGSQGVGFAVPIDMARAEMDQILKHGKVIRGYLGVQVQPVTADMAKVFGLQKAEGAIVADVTPDSPAAKSGLQRGDVIVDLNGARVEDSRQLSLSISQMAPGTNVKVTLQRDGKMMDRSVTLGELPSNVASTAPEAGTTGPHLGISVESLTPQISRQLGLPAATSGIAITQIESGSAAEEAGLHRGDVIQQVNRKPVGTPDEFVTAVRAGGTQPVLLLIERGGDHLYLVVTPH
ncbi:MAG: DegQ family serine endoprotease [Bryobacteraceae bacterium]